MNKPLSSVVRIQKARTTLLLDHPFFGTLLFRLGAQARSSIATMATDGVSLVLQSAVRGDPERSRDCRNFGP